MKEERNYTPDEAVVLGAQLDDSGRLDEAEGIFRAILTIDPAHFHALQRLGVVLAKKRQFYEALYRLDRALKIERKSALVRGNRGMVLDQLGHHDEACMEFQRSLAIDPNNPIVWANLGNTFERLGEFRQSLDALNRSLALDADSSVTFYNRGITLVRLGRHHEALADFKAAIALEPDNAEAHFNLGLVQLLLGNYPAGFKDYEWRWETADYASYRDRFPQPKWTGQVDIAGKSLLVYGDQGLGDSLMFARYVPLLHASGAKLFMIAHKGLTDLWRASFPYATVFEGGEPMPQIDYRVSLPSLPLAYGTTLDSVPAPMAFQGFTERLPYWQSHIHGGALKVGVCWSGNWTHKNDEHRSIPLAAFRRLFDARDGVEFYSLQYEVREMDKPHLVDANLARPQLRDWFDTAAVCSLMDLVITVDSSVAHLAGSLGVPTWTLLPQFGTDWRWGLTSDRTPWYPSMHLLRQSTQRCWDPVLNQVSRELDGLGVAESQFVA